MEDFRSDKMESREGKGVARRAWDGYARAIGRTVTPAIMPLTRPLLRRFSVNKAVDLVGFWVIWHLHGGFEGLQKLGMGERTIYRQIKWFRLAYGEHPDAFVMPGVRLDREAYFAVGATKRQPKGK